MDRGEGPVTQAMSELLAVTADTKSTPEQVKQKVEAVRAARAKARAELQAAQKELLELLTTDQEAVLVGLGYID